MAKTSVSKKSKQSYKKNKKRETNKKNIQTDSKRQPSGYLMFCAEQRIHRKSDFEKMKPKEIMQYLGAEWRKLSSQQQEAYKAKASNKVHHDASNKDETKSQKNHMHTKSTHHYSEAIVKSNTIHNATCSKSSSKKKKNSKAIKSTNGKSVSHKLAHHNEHHHEADNKSSE